MPVNAGRVRGMAGTIHGWGINVLPAGGNEDQTRSFELKGLILGLLESKNELSCIKGEVFSLRMIHYHPINSGMKASVLI